MYKVKGKTGILNFKFKEGVNSPLLIATASLQAVIDYLPYIDIFLETKAKVSLGLSFENI